MGATDKARLEAELVGASQVATEAGKIESAVSKAGKAGESAFKSFGGAVSGALGNLVSDGLKAAGVIQTLSLANAVEETKRLDLATAKLGQKLVFTNGCFDLLHVGHLRLLRAARAMGDVLLVAVNSDDSVRRLKGPTRPVVSQEDRAALLAGLEAVDFVTLFDEDTPLEAILACQPDVLVKGGDYSPATIVGAPEVERWGGRVAVIPLVEGRSTTSMVHRAGRT